MIFSEMRLVPILCPDLFKKVESCFWAILFNVKKLRIDTNNIILFLICFVICLTCCINTINQNAKLNATASLMLSSQYQSKYPINNRVIYT